MTKTGLKIQFFRCFNFNTLCINYLLDHNPRFQLDQKCSLIFFCLTCLRLNYVVERSRLIVMFGVGNAVYGRAIHNQVVNCYSLWITIF